MTCLKGLTEYLGQRMKAKEAVGNLETLEVVAGYQNHFHFRPCQARFRTLLRFRISTRGMRDSSTSTSVHGAYCTDIRTGTH